MSTPPPAPEPTAAPPPGFPANETTTAVSAKVKNAIAIVITIMWAGGIVADAALKDFALSPFVYTTMLGLAASIYGSSFVRGITR